jgi:hypothetical protein
LQKFFGRTTNEHDHRGGLQKVRSHDGTLRYYERIGLIPPVGRGAGGVRRYTEFDCDWIDFIKCMHNSGVQVEALISPNISPPTGRSSVKRS